MCTQLHSQVPYCAVEVGCVCVCVCVCGLALSQAPSCVVDVCVCSVEVAMCTCVRKPHSLFQTVWWPHSWFLTV